MNSSMHGAEVFALRAFVVEFGSDSRSELDSVGMATEIEAMNGRRNHPISEAPHWRFHGNPYDFFIFYLIE
jgi:hypothetical protein